MIKSFIFLDSVGKIDESPWKGKCVKSLVIRGNPWLFYHEVLLKVRYFVSKIVLTYFEKKKCSSHREKLLKFEADGRDVAKFLRSVEQLIQTVEGQNNFRNRILF